MGCKCNHPNLESNIEFKPEIVTPNQIDEQLLLKQEEYMKKYSDYPQKMVYLINKIRKNPNDYANVIEESIKNIIEEENESVPYNPILIYKQKVKVALIKGEPAFREAANELRNMKSIPPLEFKEDICIELPDNMAQFKDSNYLREKVKEIISKKIQINVYFKEMIKEPDVSALLMIVDDNGKNSGKKRKAILNKEYKYIGISFRFIGKTFMSYFSFSK